LARSFLVADVAVIAINDLRAFAASST